MKNQGCKKVLVIEYETRVRNQFVMGLRAEGFNAVGAQDGWTGLQQTQAYSPDLITCGITIPGLDGFTVLKKLREDPTTAIIPFIFVTTRMNRSDLHKAMELGANGYLIKPCTVEELLATVTAQTERQSLLHQHYTSPVDPLQETHQTLQLLDLSALSLPTEVHDSPLKEVFDFIVRNYYQPITLNDVAQAVGYSPAYLTSLIGRKTGQTVQQWIIQCRMTAACTLLQETDQPIEQIATQVGYRNPVHFFRQFRRLHGTTPQSWRTGDF